MIPELTVLEDSLTTERIVVTLMQNNLGKGHQLYVDNFYTSMSLVKHLQNDTNITGTIRENRKHFPTVLKGIQLNKGESAYFQHEDLVVLKFRSHKKSSSGKPKIVYLLTTAHKPALGNTTK